jgi:hypothetical protein
MTAFLRKLQSGWRAACEAWSSYEVRESTQRPRWELESQIEDLEKLREVAADKFGRQSKLFLLIDLAARV